MEQRDEAIENGRATLRSRLVQRLVALAPVLWLGAACSSDIFDVDVDLAPRTFSADFGAPSGTIPTVTCDPSNAGVCGAGQIANVESQGNVPAIVSVSLGCDAATARCYAQANARVAYEINVLMDDSFVQKVERRAVSFVRRIDLAYTIPTNTLTFDIPTVDVYVGPAGSTVETDEGVAFVDSISPVTAGEIVTDPRPFTLAEDSPARNLIADKIKAKEPFVVLVVAAPRLEAGAPIPAGAFELVIYPSITVGLP